MIERGVCEFDQVKIVSTRWTITAGQGMTAGELVKWLRTVEPEATIHKWTRENDDDVTIVFTRSTEMDVRQ